MGRQGKHNYDTHMLRRIVAMMVALASLAERAAGLSRPVRSAILWIPTLAFSRTAQTVVQEADAFGFDIDFSTFDALETADAADDLMRISRGFSGLARILTFLIGYMHEMARNPEPDPAACRLEANLSALLRTLQRWPQPSVAIIDTS